MASSSNSGFCVITWNIDGLDKNDVEERTLAVCKTLQRYAPDIVFLQEVIPKTLKLISAQLGKNYKALPANDLGYFTLVLLKSSTVTYVASEIEQFSASTQGRALQIVNCQCAGIDLRLICTHLESEANRAVERQRQFTRALDVMKAAPDQQTVLLGGDTNLLDEEVVKVGLPGSILDLWEMCGCPDDAKYTWDMTENNNRVKTNPRRHRIDRLFLRHAKTSPRVEQGKFGLIGKERLVPCDRFPSDHWGILCSFKVRSPQVP